MWARSHRKNVVPVTEFPKKEFLVAVEIRARSRQINYFRFNSDAPAAGLDFRDFIDRSKISRSDPFCFE
jgi:hypothetical protein